MKATIRIAVAEDAPAIAELLDALMTLHRETPPPRIQLEHSILSIIASPHSWYLVADGHGGILGVLQVRECFSSWAGAMYGYVEDVCVRPEMRSRGIGGTLIAFVHQCSCEKGWARLDLDVLVDNHRARAFYEQRGFRDTGYLVYRAEIATDY